MAEQINKATDAQASVPGSAAEALAKHEAAKMSRREVLAKIGFKAGAAALLALSADDLARKVTQAIAASNRDNATAQAVANEFKNAGVIFANPGDGICTSEICIHCYENWGGGRQCLCGHCDLPGGCCEPSSLCCEGQTVHDWCWPRHSCKPDPKAACRACCRGTYRNMCSGYSGGNIGELQACLDSCDAH